MRTKIVYWAAGCIMIVMFLVLTLGGRHQAAVIQTSKDANFISTGTNTGFTGKYIEAKKNNVPLYDRSRGKMDIAGLLDKGQELQVAKDYDPQWWEFSLGNHLGFVSKNDVTETTEPNFKNSISAATLFTKSIITTQDTPVYDQSSGRLMEFAKLTGNHRYPVISIDSQWVRVGIGGRYGFVNRNSIQIDKGIPVLTYHHLLEDNENKIFRTNGTTITPESFNQQMQYLAQQGFETITTGDLEKYIKGEVNLPGKAVLITFDDGLQSVYRYGFPILQKYHLKATEFMITGRITARPSPWNPDKATSLSKPEMAAMEGTFEFQSHSNLLHAEDPAKKALALVKPFAAVKADFMESKNILNAHSFAYPFGQYNQQTIQILKELGFTGAYTLKPGYVNIGDDPMQIKRFGVTPSVTFEKFKAMVDQKEITGKPGTSPE